MATQEAVISVTLDPAFARLLQRQDDLQAFLLGKRPIDLDPEEKAAYIRTQAFATIAEVVEATDETHWKPWSVRPEGEEVVISQTRFTGELADVYIFLMNLMLAGGVTAMDLAKAVANKQQKNLDRWTSGYNAKTTKCPACRRSYDDEGVDCYPSKEAVGILDFCAVAGRFLDKDGATV